MVVIKKIIVTISDYRQTMGDNYASPALLVEFLSKPPLYRIPLRFY